MWENYDFVPGNTVLFFTDFSEDKVGNFARGLKYVSGPMEVVERDGVKVLRSIARSTLLIPVGRVLPQRFTLEFDILSMNTGINDQLVFEGGKDRDRGTQSAEIDWSPRGTFIIGGRQNMGNSAVSIPGAMPSSSTPITVASNGAGVVPRETVSPLAASPSSVLAASVTSLTGIGSRQDVVAAVAAGAVTPIASAMAPPMSFRM